MESKQSVQEEDKNDPVDQKMQEQDKEEKLESKEEPPKDYNMHYLCLVGVEKHMIDKDLKKLFDKCFPKDQELPVEGIHKKRGESYAFLKFKDLDQKNSFSEQLVEYMKTSKHKYRLREITKKIDKKMFKPLKSKEEEKKEEPKKQVATAEEIAEEMKISIEDKVTPYHKFTYEEQIQKKTQYLESVLKSFSKDLKKQIQSKQETKPLWISNEQLEGTPCPLDHVIQCDEDYLLGYRNKVEFTIGNKYEGNEICVGFNKGNINKGIIYVDNPDNIKAISETAIIVAKQVEMLVKELKFQPYDRIKNEGFLRILLFRESKRTKQLLITLIVSENYKEEEEITKQKLKELFKVGQVIGNKDQKLVSLSMIFSSEISGAYKEGDRVEVLSGDEFYIENLYGFMFKVSPFSFFQVNTNVFEKMLDVIKQFCQIDNKTTVLDICCGTGAIGICLSQDAEKIIGIELIAQAIEDAKENVKLNESKIPNDKCEFHAGRAEELLPNIVKTIQNPDKKIIGIVDPPRSGLHKDVLKALRTCKGLDRLVYVSCNSESQMRDMKDLCYADCKKRKAPPFKPIRCFGADLFPHTNHVESIILMERFYE